MLMPSSLNFRSSSASACFSLIAQAGRRFVEQQQRRVAAQRAGDFQDALLTERQAAGFFVQHVAQTDALELLFFGFEQQGLFFGLVQAGMLVAMTRHIAVRASQMRADGNVLQHASWSA
jgi:hypothetical protein